ncbi:MAG: hypothetical protein ABIR32_09505 [Ilumatobacteraceae bacterium]
MKSEMAEQSAVIADIGARRREIIADNRLSKITDVGARRREIIADNRLSKITDT